MCEKSKNITVFFIILLRLSQYILFSSFFFLPKHPTIQNLCKLQKHYITYIFMRKEAVIIHYHPCLRP